jgi:hypothetical protein
MITRGSKYFFGAAAVAYLTALVYGFITGASAHGGVLDVFSNGDIVNSVIGPISFGWKGWVGDQIGYSVLMGFAGIMVVIGGFTSVFRDGSPEALAELQGATVERGEITGARVDLRVVTPQGLSAWPIVAAFSGGAVIVGLAYSTVLFGIGCGGLVVAGLEWTVKAWSERATGDAVQNKAIRDHLMHPLEIPIGAVLGAALVIFCMSRILLAVPKVGAVFFIIIVATLVFVVAILLASRPDLKRSIMVTALLLFGLLIIAGGIIGGVVGPREVEEHGGEEASLGVAAVVAEHPAGQIGIDGLAVGH